MSLYGALYSGVSGLTAQSSAMGSISDNITNVSTIGYKNTSVNFQTLVTKQASSTFYSAGGVQSKPRQAVDVQGLLQASTSQTDIAISGGGFFVVNGNNQPGTADPYFYTRAGSFKMDSSGYLSNSAGYYLQAWPTDASGTVIPANTSLSQSNLNVISSDYLSTVNLARVAGSAAATTTMSIGANLPATAVAGDSHKTDVPFYDSLGTARSISFNYLKAADNEWDIAITQPPETAVVTSYDSDGVVYDSTGQLEFNDRPADGSTVVIGTITYEFDSDATVSGTNTAVDISASTTLAADVAALIATVKATDSNFTDYTTTAGTSTNSRISLNADYVNIINFQDDGTGAIAVNPSALLDANGDAVTNQTAAFSVLQPDSTYAALTNLTFGALPADNDTLVINGITYEFDSNASGVTVGDVAVDSSSGVISTILGLLATAIEANDPYYPAGTVLTRDVGTTGAINTLALNAITGLSYTVDATSYTGGITDTYTNTVNGLTSTVSQTQALNFSSSGQPSSINVASVEIIGFANGASDMDGTTSSRIAVDFGTIASSDGMTQFGSEFTPGDIQQNGSKFGTFAGVSISDDGLVTALFDNGDTRPVYQIPVATFTNPNGMESRSGNVWNASEKSGDYTLRTAGNGAAGVVTQASLEASTVDIGEEFTNMIVVQRAYSASTKIISTADQMLEELMRVKR